MLDGVINVSPGLERVAGLAARRARRLFGLVYPRGTRVVRLNCRHESDAPSTEKPVRACFRSGDAIERIAR